MYKVLVADDEMVIRKGIVNFIDWDSIGCKVVAEAENGTSAMQILSSHDIDIFISDIKMPGCSGIDLAQYVFESKLDIAVIFLTGYEDFEYAKSAIKYGVVDFILKPSTAEAITNAVQKACGIICQRRSYEQRIKSLESSVSQYNNQACEKLLLNILNEAVQDPDQIQRTFQELHLNIGVYCMLLLDIFFIDNHSSHSQTLDMFRTFLTSAFDGAQTLTVAVSDSALCAMVSYNTPPNEDLPCYISNICARSFHILSSFAKCKVIIGISNKHSGPSDIFEAYCEARQASNSSFSSDEQIFLYRNKEKSFQAEFPSDVMSKVDLILKHVQLHQPEQAIKETENVFSILTASQSTYSSYINVAVMLYSGCSRILYSIGFAGSDEFPAYFRKITKVYHRSPLFNLLSDMLTFACEKVASYSNPKDLVTKAIAYITEHYRSNISLQELSEQVYVSKSHLSRTFRKMTGETLTDYIVKYRISQAKELLQSEYCKTYTVATMVGFNDPAYFSFAFKKYTGFTPTEYQRLHRNMNSKASTPM